MSQSEALHSICPAGPIEEESLHVTDHAKDDCVVSNIIMYGFALRMPLRQLAITSTHTAVSTYKVLKPLQ
jgi:hypothetical protein